MKRFASRILAAAACLTLALPGHAEFRPGLNLSGQTGIIDMPSGEQLPDGYLTIDHSKFGPILRNSLRFQITPRLSGTFRYIGIHQWNDKFCPPDCDGANAFSTYYDRNFDLSYQILKEGRYVPALSIGLQDFVGTGLSSAEYIAATKNVSPRLKVTGGIGFGRLGSYGSFGSPFGSRAKIDIGKGGNFNFKQWFRGKAAAFGGLEYQLSDKLVFKAEYSSDAYTEEAKRRGAFDRKSPFNFGLEYRPNPSFSVGGYYMYGSEVGINLTLFLNPGQRPQGGMGGPAPEPLLVRPSRASDPIAWSTDWTRQSDAKAILMENLTANLERTGITIESIGVTATRVQVRFINTQYDATAQAVGRVARAMSQVMPASVEMFEIVPVDHGVPAAKVVIRRLDMEELEFAPEAGPDLRVRTDILDATGQMADSLRNSKAYPRVDWSILPFVRTYVFNPRNPLQASYGLRATGQIEVSPGFILSGSVTELSIKGIDENVGKSSSRLQHVRSDSVLYATKGNPDLETLTAAWYTNIAPAVYGRVTAGYLEQMFGGISAEVLWRPEARNWALGVEANYVAQRNTDGGLGFDEYDYRVATGHVSGYYDFQNGYHMQVDVGRYLAGDFGATIKLTRVFENGWEVGAFATKTNVSAKDFGEGSFDKGIVLSIPLAWFTGKPTRTVRSLVIRPIGRDGGARLNVNDRLYDVLHSYDTTKLDAQWARVWK